MLWKMRRTVAAESALAVYVYGAGPHKQASRLFWNVGPQLTLYLLAHSHEHRMRYGWHSASSLNVQFLIYIYIYLFIYIYSYVFGPRQTTEVFCQLVQDVAAVAVVIEPALAVPVEVRNGMLYFPPHASMLSEEK